MSGSDKISGRLWSDVVRSLMMCFNDHARFSTKSNKRSVFLCDAQALYNEVPGRAPKDPCLNGLDVCVCVMDSVVECYHKLPPFFLCGVLIFFDKCRDDMNSPRTRSKVRR